MASITYLLVHHLIGPIPSYMTILIPCRLRGHPGSVHPWTARAGQALLTLETFLGPAIHYMQPIMINKGSTIKSRMRHLLWLPLRPQPLVL
jgi:hypothetical protein